MIAIRHAAAAGHLGHKRCRWPRHADAAGRRAPPLVGHRRRGRDAAGACGARWWPPRGCGGGWAAPPRRRRRSRRNRPRHATARPGARARRGAPLLLLPLLVVFKPIVVLVTLRPAACLPAAPLAPPRVVALQLHRRAGRCGAVQATPPSSQAGGTASRGLAHAPARLPAAWVACAQTATRLTADSLPRCRHSAAAQFALPMTLGSATHIRTCAQAQAMKRTTTHKPRPSRRSAPCACRCACRHQTLQVPGTCRTAFKSGNNHQSTDMTFCQPQNGSGRTGRGPAGRLRACAAAGGHGAGLEKLPRWRSSAAKRYTGSVAWRAQRTCWQNRCGTPSLIR